MRHNHSTAHASAVHLAEIQDALLELTRSGVVILDAHFRVIRANQNFFDQLHLKSDRITGKNIFDVFPSALLIDSSLAQALQRVKRTGQPIKLTDIRYSVGPNSIKTLNVTIRCMGSSTAVGFVMVWDDISDQVEKIFELSMVRQINDIMMQRHMSLDRLLHLILTCVTAGSALGFNRAFLLLVDKDGKWVRGQMGVGPQSREDVYRIWAALGAQWQPLKDFLAASSYTPEAKDSPVAQMVSKMKFSMSQTRNVVVASIHKKKACKVTDALRDARVNAKFRDIYTAKEFVIVPLMGRQRVLGVIIADNIYSNEPITEDQVQLLTMFANQAGLAIETAKTYRNLQKDRNQLRQAYQTLKNTQNKLMNAEKLAAIGKMAAYISHEIRNPLVTIGGFARSVLKAASLQEVHQAADIILEETTRLEKILDEVLDFSRPIRPEFKFYDVNEVLRESCVLVSEELKSRGITLRRDLGENLQRIFMDPGQLKQAILNILKNAIYAMPLGGALSITSARRRAHVEVMVVDTGSGISQSVMPQLFTPFFTTRQTGSGLGLAVTRQIVQEHGGTIEIRSVEGKGTTCELHLPVEKKINGVLEEEAVAGTPDR